MQMSPTGGEPWQMRRGLPRTGFLVYALLFYKGQEWGLGDILGFCAKMGGQYEEVVEEGTGLQDSLINPF